MSIFNIETCLNVKGLRMWKLAFLTVLLLLIPIIMQTATADYLVYNGNETEDAYVAYAYWMDSASSLGSGYRLMVIQPSGFVVQGYYKVAPGTFANLTVPNRTSEVYLRIMYKGQVIKPTGHKNQTEFQFMTGSCIDPQEKFSIVTVDHKIKRIRAGRQEDMVYTSGYYKYTNGDIFDISGPLKYAVRTIDFHINGRRRFGGSWRDWQKSFNLPDRVLYWRITKTRSYGHGGANLKSVTADNHKITVSGRIEDGLVIRGKFQGQLTVYYRM